jgi:uncharacterized protein YdeI (YjbR/CyaY-like superfamily)
MPAKPDLPIMPFASRKDWEAWLDEHHASSPGVWLKIAKSDAGIPTVTYAEALEAALCYGWIDGQKGAFDERFWLQRFTPRKPRSRWSRLNREKAEALLRAKRMKPAGLREIERAKADGRWDAAYASPKNAAVPEDLQAALDRDPKARAFFATLSSANRYAILYRIQEAKKPDTRARRIATFVAMLHEGKTLH